MAKYGRGVQNGNPVTFQTLSPVGEVQMETFIPWTLVRRGIRRKIITPLDAPQEFLTEANRDREVWRAGQDSALIRALGLAHFWQCLLDEGRFSSMTEIAAAEGIDLGQASKICRLVQLAPNVVEDIVHGHRHTNLNQLLRSRLPIIWAMQHETTMVSVRGSSLA